jgi:AraC family transcriptional regulator of adaptative response / DNA-3-methyladenine glycosylase II
MLDPDLTTSAAHRPLAERATRWAPWRSYAAMHLWNAPNLLEGDRP